MTTPYTRTIEIEIGGQTFQVEGEFDPGSTKLQDAEDPRSFTIKHIWFEDQMGAAPWDFRDVFEECSSLDLVQQKVEEILDHED